MIAISRTGFVITLGVIATGIIAASAPLAQAQYSYQRDSYQYGPADRIVQEQWGNQTRRYRLDERYPDAQYVLPNRGPNQFQGGYFFREGHPYYIPEGQYDDRRGRFDPRRVEFGGFTHIEDLALRFVSLANDLALDLHYNYSHNRGFRETYAEAYQLLQEARFIRNQERLGNRAAIPRRLNGLDNLFHHVEDDIRRWTRRERRQIGRGDAFTKLQQIEAIIHHIMYDAGIAVDPEGVPRGRRVLPGPAPRPRPR